MAKRIGFIGLGSMGKPIAINILKKGFDLMVLDTNPKPVEELKAMGAKVASTPEEIAENTEIGMTCLPEVWIIEDVALGPNGLIHGARPGWIYLDASTCDPVVSKKIEEAMRAKGIRMLDGPVSGGIPTAYDGRLSTMISGSEDLFQECREVIQCYTSKILYVGEEVGTANAMKLVNNLMTCTNLVIAAEGLVLAAKAGLNLKTVYELVKVSTGASNIFERRGPYMLTRYFEPEGAIEVAYKDLELLSLWARRLRVPIVMPTIAQQIYQACRAMGLSNKDFASTVMFYEQYAGVEARDAMVESPAPSSVAASVGARKRVGFVGLGSMGKPMALNILNKGYDLTVWAHRNRQPVEELKAAGAKEAKSLRELAEGTDVVITCVPSSLEVAEIALGPNGLLEGARPGWTLIDSSTCNPVAIGDIAKTLKGRGFRMLDAPVSGGIPVARAGKLTVMVGGDKETYEEHRDLLAASGANIFYMGSQVGFGNAAKLVNNLMNLSIYTASIEALAIAAKAGLNLKTVYDVVTSSSGNSNTFQRRAPRIFKGQFEPPDAMIDTCYKDLEIIADWAKSFRYPAFMVNAALQVFQACRAMGIGDKDFSALILLYERITGAEARDPSFGA